jgi:hypothetical protein
MSSLPKAKWDRIARISRPHKRNKKRDAYRHMSAWERFWMDRRSAFCWEGCGQGIRLSLGSRVKKNAKLMPHFLRGTGEGHIRVILSSPHCGHARFPINFFSNTLRFARTRPRGDVSA